MLTREIPVPNWLQFIYGTKTCLRDLLLIHGSALIASLLVLFWKHSVAGWTVGQAIVAVILAWDVVGGGVAHLMPDNRQFWRSVSKEWLVVWVISSAWQPLLFIWAFGGGLPLLAALHLGGILLVVAQQALGSRWMSVWVLLALLGGVGINASLSVPEALNWFPLLYLIKAVIFDKAPARLRRPSPARLQLDDISAL